MKDDTINIDKELKKKREKLAEQKRRKSLRNEITHKKRFDILERDNYTCVYCGRSTKDGTKDNPVKLVIDHIIPLDKGGTNDDNNLVTSCWECNEGKKARLLKRDGLKREYNISDEKKKEIFDLVEESNFEKYKAFWKNDDNEEVRQLMYDLGEMIPNMTCMKDCKKCADSGLWYYKGCMQIVNRYFVNGESIGSALNANFLPEANNTLVKLKNTEKLDVTKSDIGSLRCDACYASKRCPVYKTGSVCRLNFTSNNDINDVSLGLDNVINFQKERVARAVFFEKISGGAMDKNVSAEITLLSNLLRQKSLEGNSSVGINITAAGTGEGVSVVEKMFSKIFSSVDNSKEIKPNVEEADFEESNS